MSTEGPSGISPVVESRRLGGRSSSSKSKGVSQHSASTKSAAGKKGARSRSSSPASRKKATSTKKASSSKKKSTATKKSPSSSKKKKASTAGRKRKSVDESESEQPKRKRAKSTSPAASKKKKSSSTKSKRSPSLKTKSPSTKKKKTSASSKKSPSTKKKSPSTKKSPSRSAAAKKAARTRGLGAGSRTAHKNPNISKIPYHADADKSPKETHTPQHNPKTEKKRMSNISSKRKRQAEHIEESYEKKGMGSKRAKAIAMATVNKQRAEHGETKESKE